MNYKRYFIPNSMVFITIVTYNRKDFLLDYIDLIKRSFKYTKTKISFNIVAIVILKNHIHLILQPMTHIEELRKTLFDNGFIIDNEVVAEDGDKLYIIISAYYYGDSTAYTDLDLIVGRLPLNNDVLSKKYLLKIYEKYNKKLFALKNANKKCEDLENIVGELSKWQQ